MIDEDKFYPRLQELIQKHLFTLDPGISENQTKEMQLSNLRLVLPQPILSTYSSCQQTWLMNLDGIH
jgi:hypothetical protein